MRHKMSHRGAIIGRVRQLVDVRNVLLRRRLTYAIVMNPDAPTYRPANTNDVESIARLLTITFDTDSTPGWEREALARFYANNSPAQLDVAIATAAYQQVCEDNGEIVGYLYMPRPYLIGILAVAPSFQKQGIGTTLLHKGRDYVLSQHPEVTVLQVNATERSESFYAANGFFPISPQVQVDGMRFKRMGYWCGLAALDAEQRK